MRSAGAPQIGINRLMGGSGIANLASAHGKAASNSSTVASNADRLSLPEALTLQSSVPMLANPLHGGQRDWTLRSAYVSSVAQSTALINTNQTQPAPIRVLAGSFTRGEGSKAAVYNLEVEDTHEYFAQGILIHNCRYALYATFGHGRSAQPWLDHYFGHLSGRRDSS
jgi:hypothetical protein